MAPNILRQIDIEKYISKLMQEMQIHHNKTGIPDDEGYIAIRFSILFIICGVVSGYATFAGIRLFLDETGDTGFVVDGTAALLTIAVSAILATSWSVIVKYGPEAPTWPLKLSMLGLGAALFAITLSVSSLSNVLSLAGPAAKVHHWRVTHTAQFEYLNALETRVNGAAQLRPTWLAERDKACALAGFELESGTISGSGKGTGPVAAALSGVCQQTSSVVSSIDRAMITSERTVKEARQALIDIQSAIRNRGEAVLSRETEYLIAGDQLNASLQTLRSADLLEAIDAAASQVAASVSQLSQNSSFSARQVESITGIKDGLGGLVAATNKVSETIPQKPLPDYAPVISPDYLQAVMLHAARFIPIVAAALGIDAIFLWALFFQLTHRAGYRITSAQALAQRSVPPSPQ